MKAAKADIKYEYLSKLNRSYLKLTPIQKSKPTLRIVVIAVIGMIRWRKQKVTDAYLHLPEQIQATCLQ